MRNTKQSVILSIVATAIIGFITIFIISKTIDWNNKSNIPVSNVTDTTNVNLLDSSTIVISFSPLDSLLKEKQKLQDSLLMEVTGRGSGKAGYGPKAKAIQKQLEEMERTIEILQNYGEKANFDTLNKQKETP